MRSELTGYRRPAWLASRTTMAQADIAGTLNFEPVPGGTRMRWAWVVRPKGASRLLTPLISRIGRRQERAIWTGMKRYLEAQPQPREEPNDRDRHRAGTAGPLAGSSRWRPARSCCCISLALIAGGGTLVWADQRTGPLRLRDHEYRHVFHQAGTPWPATRLSRTALGLADACSSIGSGSGSRRPTRPARCSRASPPPVTSSATWATSATRRWESAVNTTSPTIRAPGSRRLRPPRCPGPRGSRATGTLTLTWAVRRRRLDGDGDEHRRPPGPVRPGRAGISALALPWLAGELLAAGLLTGVAAGVLIVVPVRMASRRGPGATPP